MLDRTVNWPTPQKERAFIVAILGIVLLAAFGAAVALTLIGFLLSLAAKWVFG